jgi:hypothetical protein
VNPEMGQLPDSRLVPFRRPFAESSIDYFGPYEVTIGRRREKIYGVIFTCMSIRAVHPMMHWHHHLQPTQILWQFEGWFTEKKEHLIHMLSCNESITFSFQTSSFTSRISKVIHRSLKFNTEPFFYWIFKWCLKPWIICSTRVDAETYEEFCESFYRRNFFWTIFFELFYALLALRFLIFF